MKLTMKGEYALRAMIALAQSPDGSMTISQIAEAKAIPRKFLEQILLALKGGGLLTSRAGPKGGYVLVVQPAAITAAAILRAVEEPISTGIYRKGADRPVRGSLLADVVSDIRHYVRTRLEGITLADLAAANEDKEQIEALMWHI